MNAGIDMLKRWMALERALADELGGGLVLEEFAREWGVTVRTIRRDLEVLEALGQKLIHNQDEQGKFFWEFDGNYEQEFLFVRNLPRSSRVRKFCIGCPRLKLPK